MSMDLGLKALSDVTEHTNKCPKCGRVRYFNTRAGLLKSNRKNLPCKSCSNSIKAGGEPVPRYNEKGERFCTACKDFKPESEFYNNKKGKSSICISCSHTKSKEYNRAVGKYKRYGITKEDFEQMIDNQDSKCAICNNPLDKSKEVHIDHNHETGKVRGVLCGICNKGLGQFKDSKENLKNAIKYLEKYE